MSNFIQSLLKSHFIQRVKAKLLTKLGHDRSAGAHLNVYPDDVFIVSYPRSGNTWVRFLVAGIVFQKDIDFGNMEDYVPDIYRCTHADLESRHRPRFLKSHEPYDPRYPKVIYLVRDPRDVIISYHKWLLKFGKTEKKMDEFLLDFASNRTPYGGWGNHVAGWLESASKVSDGFLPIRYEDLLEDTARELSKICSFLGLECEAEHIEVTVRRNQFSRMKSKERKSTHVDLFKGARDDIEFVRKGVAGQWRDSLSEDQVELLSESFEGIASEVGYEFS